MAFFDQLPAAALSRVLRALPGVRGRQRVVRALWRPLSLGRYDRLTTLDLADVRMLCDITKHIQRQIFFLGAYEPEFSRLWYAHALGSRTVVDVGANVGMYTLLAARANPDARVVSFEPTPGVRARLLENIRLNGFSNVVVEPIALGASSGTAVLHARGGDAADNEGMNFVTPGLGDLPLRTLDEYAREHAVDTIDLMKLDVEGSERDVLEGARGLLSRGAIRTLFLEMEEANAGLQGHTTSELREILEGHGYHLRVRRGEALAPMPAPGDPLPSREVVATSSA
jgi:FkbM family methyltransferase